MKKIYIKPDMKVVILKSRQVIMAGSVNTDGLTSHGGYRGIYNEDDEAE